MNMIVPMEYRKWIFQTRVLFDRFTVSDDAFNNINRFVSVIAMTARAPFFFSKVSHTDAAIHPTRGDEFLFHYAKPNIDNFILIKILPLK